MKYFDLFSGIGGFTLGIQQAYVEKSNRKKNRRSKKNKETNDEKQKRLVSEVCQELNSERGQLGEHYNFHLTGQKSPACVGYSEIDRWAISIYEKNFPTHKNFGDTTKIDTRKLPDFDFLVAGFPCQSFSIAGKRKGFDDTRGTLFFEIARILRDKRPRYFLLENVKGLLSHDSGKTFQTILGVLTDIGYQLEWQVLNSKNFGVPQNRERVFIVGYFGKECRPKVFPLGESNETNNQVITEINTGHQGNTVYNPKGISSTMNALGGGQGGKTGLYLINKKGKRKNKGYASTLCGGGHSGGNHSDMDLLKERQKVRRLTPTECERLQGFPDRFTETGIDEKGNEIKISDSQRYKCLGNAITTCVVKEIILRLINE